MEDNTMQGTVKFFDTQKGYGFIKGDDGRDYFVHITKLGLTTIDSEDRVEFEIIDGRKGKEAANLQLI